MNVSLFTGAERWLILGAAVLLAGAAALLRRRRAPVAVVASLAVLAALGVASLLVEQAIGFVVSREAPASTDFNEFRWVLLSPWGRTGLVLGLIAVAAIIGLSFRASAKLASPWRRAALIGLRTGAATAALILFLQPAVELRQVAREPNRIAVVVDDSVSMGLQEVGGGPSRHERARSLLSASAPVFDRWRQKHHVDFFGFSDALVQSSETAAATAEPSGAGTLIRQTLEQLRSRYDGRDLAGVILVSDGVPTDELAGGATDGTSRDFLSGLQTRVHTAWVGRPGLRDVAISRVLADEFAFVRTVIKIEVVIRSTGYPRRRIPVTLTSEGKPLRQKWVEVGADDSETRVVFELSPPKVGKFVYTVETPVSEDEAVHTNNSRSFVLRVIRDKIRVLQVAGQPSWDVQALRRMLKQNPNVDLISFFILRTQDDVSLVPNDEMSLIPFPTHELFQDELPSFDLIVLQNFEYLPYGIGAYLENIRSYVEGGGGLAMLGGPLSFSSGGYAGSPVGAALPVTLERLMSPRDAVDTTMFRPELTKTGKVHPVTSLRYEASDNVALWKALPELEGVNIIGDAKPGASVLATHPRLRTKSGKPMPVIVAGEYGEGRSLAVTTDSLWRWGFAAPNQVDDQQGDGRYYDKLWETSMRWLIQDPELRYLHVDSDHVEYAPQTPVRIDVRLLDRNYAPLAGGEVTLEVTRGADPNQVVAVHEATLHVGEAGEGSHDLAGLGPGVYRVRARAKVGDRPVEATDIFLVREGTEEMDRPAAREDVLRAIAAATGGTYLGKVSELPSNLAFDQPRIVRVDRRSDVELWSRPALLFLALLLLGLEWLLRQRSGYL
jgi:uncharacterized membrane protein